MKHVSVAEVARAYNEGARCYDERHSRKLSRKYVRIEASMRKLLSGGRVLDLGTGTGRLMHLIPREKGIGLDLSLQMLKNRTAGKAVVCADAHHLPFADESFDVVVAAQGVMRYLDAKKAMTEIYRVLRAGGRFASHHFGTVLQLRTLKRKKTAYGISNPREVTTVAETIGFHTRAVELWRPVPFYPYAVRLHESVPGNLWTHCVTHFAKGQLR